QMENRMLEGPPFNKLPIIAMTAHAMKGDEQKCLDAGMDGYVTKPINQDQLFQVLSNFINVKEQPEPDNKDKISEKPTPSIDSLGSQGDLPLKLPGINVQAAMNTLSFQPGVFKRILLGFSDNNQDTTEKLHIAYTGQDWKTLRNLAHSLKGSGANIGASELTRSSSILEIESKDGDTNPPTVSMVNAVETALKEVLDSIKTLTGPVAEPPSVDKEEPVNIEDLAAILKHLFDAVCQYDLNIMKVDLDRLKKVISSPAVQKLETQINNYDYSEVLETLKEIAEINAVQID
ncbi:response regulator, partial [bacterium]|nr:response regulator [bacterium]